MKHRILTFATAAAFLAVTGLAVADHNSKNGEGWANMPNDVHNTRIETKEADDNEAFRDFVKYGEGSRTENRFDPDSSTPTQAGPRQDMARAQEQKRVDQDAAKTQDMARTQDRKRVDQDMAKTQDMARAQDRKRIDQNTATETRSRSEMRSRQRLDTPSMSRTNRPTNTMRSNTRRGGRKN